MSADRPPWAGVAHPASPATPRLRYVVDLPAGERGSALLSAALTAVREASRRAIPGGALHTALVLLAGGRVEEMTR